MKKLWISLAAALVITFSGMAVNYQSFQNFGRLKYAYRIFGGEITAEWGFGLHSVIIFAMTETERTERSLSFSPLNFVITVVFFALAVFLVLKAIELFRKK